MICRKALVLIAMALSVQVIWALAGSSHGVDYTNFQSASAPEPATFGIGGLVLALVVYCARRRPQI